MDNDIRSIKRREYMHEWRVRNKEKIRAYNHGYFASHPQRDDHQVYMKGYFRRIREAALNAYGGKCACCGEDTYQFLCIDHINGGGNEHRKTVTGAALPGWLRKNGYPKGYQVLCHNCNMAKGAYGSCPHGNLASAS